MSMSQTNSNSSTISNLLLSFSIHRTDNRVVSNRQYALQVASPTANILEQTEQYSCPTSFVRKLLLPAAIPLSTLTLSLIINNKTVESTQILHKQLIQALGNTIALRIYHDYVIQIHVWPYEQPETYSDKLFITFGTRGMSGRTRRVGECVAAASVRGVNGRWVTFSRSSCGVMKTEACIDNMPTPPYMLDQTENEEEIDPIVKIEAWRVKKRIHDLVGTAMTPVSDLRNGEIGTCIAIIREDGRRMGYVEIRKKILTAMGIEIVLDIMVNVKPVGRDLFAVVMKDSIVPSIPIIECLWLNPRQPQIHARRGGMWAIRAILSGIGVRQANNVVTDMITTERQRNNALTEI